ncbi:MAG: magnesium transporter CorA family protein [Promethearchaeota archaeon]
MIKYFKLVMGKGLVEIENPRDVSELTWCDVKDPTKPEIKLISTFFKINPDDIHDALDITERPRYNYDLVLKNQYLLLRGIQSDNINVYEPSNPTIPIGLFYTPNEKIVTIHKIEYAELDKLILQLNKKELKSPLLLFLELIQLIFSRLDQVSHHISIKISEIQQKLLQSRNVPKFHEPFKLNSFMIFFSSATMGNYNAIRAYINKNKALFEKDPELYEKVDDLKIDIEQVYQFSTIYQDQVKNLADQTHNLINNKLNQVFKVVGTITLILEIPMLIASFYGMNVYLPGGIPVGNDFSVFIIIMMTSFAISVVIWVIFRKLGWL